MFTQFALLKNWAAVAIYTSPRYEGDELTRCEFFERRRAIFAPVGVFTLVSCCMCGNKCKKHGNTRCSCEETVSKRDVGNVRRCPKQVHVCFFTMKNIIG